MVKLQYSAETIWGLRRFAAILPAITKKALRIERLLKVDRRSTSKNLSHLPQPKHILCALINTRSAVKHRLEIHDFLLQNDLDCLFITESWLSDDCNTILGELVPENYRIITENRIGQRGGGLAVIHKNHITITKPALQNPLPFMETLTLQLQTSPQETVHILLCYRPPGPKSQFLPSLTEFISTYTLNSKHLLLLGDFNLWANSSQDPIADACIDHLGGIRATATYMRANTCFRSHTRPNFQTKSENKHFRK